MTKDEMKNKISMTLKDPILQQGFEIICKEIADLEKELEQAKKVQVVEHFEAYGQCRDSRRIASLEKENAELNKKLFKAEEEYDKMFWNKNEIISKAKELLKKLYDETRGYINDQGFDIKILAEAEQFLKESE